MIYLIVYGSLFLYFFVGWFGTYMFERFYQKRIFGPAGWQTPRSLVVISWPIALFFYFIYIAWKWSDKSGWYERLEKKLRGF